MVLARGIVKGLSLYKAKEITWLMHSCKSNILRSKILGYCFKSLIYEREVESESVKGDLSSAAAAEMWRHHRRCSAETPQRRHRRHSAEAPQKAQVWR